MLIANFPSPSTVVRGLGISKVVAKVHVLKVQLTIACIFRYIYTVYILEETRMGEKEYKIIYM